MIPLFFCNNGGFGIFAKCGKGEKHMGKTTSKKMIPLLILRILWKHADKEHMVTMDFICNRMEEDFEAERRMTRLGLQKLVSSNIRQLNLFFQKHNGNRMDKRNCKYVKERLQTQINRAVT